MTPTTGHGTSTPDARDAPLAGAPPTGPGAGRRAVFRVILRMDVEPGSEGEFERVWLDVARAVAADRANLGQWLMRGADGGATYYVVTDWRDEAAFRAFERSAAHRDHRGRLDRHRRGGWMAATEVVHALPAAT